MTDRIKIGIEVRPRVLAVAVMLALPVIIASVSPVMAQQPNAEQAQQTWQLNIASKPLPQAIADLAAATGLQVLYIESSTFNHTAPAVQGRYTVNQALQRLLVGSGLVARFTGDNAVTIELANDDGVANLSTLMVSDTVVMKSNAQLKDLPESYAGGQVARGSRIGMLGNQDVFDTPFSVTSYTADFIQHQQARTVADVIVNDSSTHLITSSQSGSETFSIRGFNTGGSGAELYDGLPRLSHRRYSTVEKLERVEVFKGANALLTGTTGSVGGTINLVPKKPLDHALTQINATYESDARLGVHADVSRRFGSSEQFGIRANGIYRDGESAFENNKEELKDMSLAFDADFGKLRTLAIVDYSKQDLDGANQLFMTTAAPAVPNLVKAIQQPWEHNESRFMRGLLKAEYDLNDNWTMHAAYGASDFKGYWVRTIGVGLNQFGDFTQNAQQQSDVQTAKTGVAGIRGQFLTGSISHAVSAEHMRSEVESGRLAASIPGASITSNLYQPVFRSRPVLSSLTRDPRKAYDSVIESTAIVDTIGFMDDHVMLTLGVRHQRVSADNYNATTGLRTSSYDESAITPTVAVLVKATDTLSFYGNYIESLESGPTAPTGTVNEGEIFPPSKTKQIEFGAKLDFGLVGLTAGVFELERPSGIINAANRYGLNGEQRHRGLELSAFGQLHPQLRVLGSATYMDSELIKTQNGTFDGKKGIGVPDLSAVLGVEWDSQLIPNLTLTGRVNYTAEQYISSDNSQTIPSYSLYAAGARYKVRMGSKDVTITAGVDNLFGKDYWSTFVGSPGLLYVGSPRRAYLGLSMDI